MVPYVLPHYQLYDDIFYSGNMNQLFAFCKFANRCTVAQTNSNTYHNTLRICSMSKYSFQSSASCILFVYNINQEKLDLKKIIIAGHGNH